jgi:hypothetical protein
MSANVSAMVRCVSLIVVMAFSGMAYAQTQREVLYDSLGSQVAVQYQYTDNSYFYRNLDGSLSGTNLNGGSIEFANRHFYPWEIVSKVSYAKGAVLAQNLQSYTAGAGYTRGFGRFQPFVRLTAGIARTHSNDAQYLYQPPNYGMTFIGGGGLDMRILNRWGVRAIEFDSQYVPYGSNSSVYRSFGSGIFYSFGR